MKFLANENMPIPGIIILREAGLNILSIYENYRGYTDEKVVELAVKENLIIPTFDRDNGEIIFRYCLKNPPSVIYFKTKGTDPGYSARILLNLIHQHEIIFENTFTVISDNNIRQRKYK